jgi:ligand-binding sensor domain-containing protein
LTINKSLAGGWGGIDMKRISWFLLSLLLLSLACGCIGNGSTEATQEVHSPVVASTTPISPTQQETIAPDKIPEKIEGEEVMLWAAGASANSSAGETRYHADQALYEPNTLACGDFVTAWQPAEDSLEATLELYFDIAILPAEVHVAQSFQPGQITRVEVVTVDGETLTIYDASEDAYAPSPDCPVTNVFWMPEVEALINQVRLTVARDESDPWTQIDAVGIWGWASEPPSEETVVSEPPADEDFYTPVYFTNKDQVTSLAFTEGILWAGSEGGVVAWDLDDGTYTAYTASEGLPKNRVTAIVSQGTMVYAGGSAGVAALSLDGAPFFSLIDHPDDEWFGDVTALSCDDNRGYIWVGYTGHLSRYDPEDGSWMEFSQQDGMPADTVRSITFIGEDVWVATAMGVVVLHDGIDLEYFSPENSVIPSAFVHNIIEDSTGRVWLVNDEGLMGHYADEGVWSFWPSQEIQGGGFSDGLMSLATGPDGTFWIADFFGTLCQFDPESTSCLQSLTPPEDVFSLSAMAVDSQGRVAVGGLTSGVQIYDGETWQVLQTDDEAADNTFWAVTYTPDGQLWLAGEAALQHFNADRPDLPWETLSLPGDGQAHSFYVASDGLWIGHTQGALFLPYLPDEARIELSLGDAEEGIADTVTTITVDGAGRVYFGTCSGLSILDGTTFQYFNLLEPTDSSYPPQVNALLAEGETVWVGAANGLYKFEAGEYRGGWTGSLQSTSSQNVRFVGVIAASPDGSGLLVGVGRDIFVFDGISFDLALTLPSEIRSIYIHPNLIWLGTASSGLYSVPVDSAGVVWNLASAGDGFAEKFSYQAIVMSDAHTVWFAGMEGGLMRQRALWGQ